MIKKHLTRILSFTLALSILLTTPLSVYATNTGAGSVENNAENNGGGETTVGTYEGNPLGWDTDAQGYRLYIVDKNLVRISPVYDFLYKNPTDIGSYERTTRFDGPSSPSVGTTENIYLINDLQSWCNSSQKVPSPLIKKGNTWYGNGTEFKDWFFNGQAGNTINVSSGSNTKPSNTVDVAEAMKKPNTTLVSILNPDYSIFWNGIDVAQNHMFESAPPPTMPVSRYNEIDLIASEIERNRDLYYNIYCSDIGSWYDWDGDGKGDTQVTESKLKDYARYLADNDALNAYGDTDYGFENVSYAMAMVSNSRGWFASVCTPTPDSNSTVSDNANGGSGSSSSSSNGSNGELITGGINLGDIDVSKYYDAYEQEKQSSYLPTDKNSLITQSIPLASNESGGGAGMPAYELINKNDTIKVPGYTHAGKALEDGGYLIVEPILWLKVRINNGGWIKPSSYEPTNTYGTFWNLAKKWKVNSAGFYKTPMEILYNNCLLVSNTITTETGKTVQGTDVVGEMRVGESVQLMDAGVGLSLHIYDASSFDPPPTPEDTETSGDWTLHESEISKNVSTQTKTSTQVMKYNIGALDGCNGHMYCSHSCKNNCSGGIYIANSPSQTVNLLKHIIKNSSKGLSLTYPIRIEQISNTI